jgi:dsRNA-specific ribonuclease
MQAAEERGQGVRECMRVYPYDFEFWAPPGLCTAPEQPEVITFRNKKLADVMEALIGVLFESAGMQEVMRWLLLFGILPNTELVRRFPYLRGFDIQF